MEAANSDVTIVITGGGDRGIKEERLGDLDRDSDHYFILEKLDFCPASLWWLEYSYLQSLWWLSSLNTDE